METCCCCGKKMDEGAVFGLHKRCFRNWFGVPESTTFSEIIPRSQSLAPIESNGKNKSFFHGAFRKYSSRLGEENYILKVIQQGHPELQATEFLCNQIYDHLGVKVPDYYLIRYPEEHFCFVTRNFMSSLYSSSLVHIYHFLEGKDDHNCEKLASVIGEQTGRRSEQERFVTLTLADCLIGNHDRHGRNLGFIQSPKGMTLAPFYDNPSYVGLDDGLMLGADLEPRGAIYTSQSNEPTMRHYVEEWRRLGFGHVVEEFQKKVQLKKLEKIVAKSFITERRQRALVRLMTKRCRELCEI